MLARRIAFVSFLLAVAAGLYVIFGTTVTSCSLGRDAAGAAVEPCHGSTLLEKEGGRILAIVVVPILIALLPSLVPTRVATGLSAAVLWVGCIIALASIGMFFVPAAIAMTVAALVPNRSVAVTG